MMIGSGNCPCCEASVTLRLHSPEQFEDGTTHWIVDKDNDKCPSCGGWIETFTEHSKISGGILELAQREKVHR